jgi:flavin-dependent dehydrogenase
MFPKGPDKVNIGLGIQQRRTRDPLQTLLERWVTETPIFREMSVLSEDGNKSGAWPVSVRHQNDSLVANGFMLAGDSGWFPNPISAGGIGPAMTGGVIAGRVAVSALQAKDASEQNLWSYNTAYVDEYGRKTAALETFRIYLQTLDNSELDYGLRNFVSQEEASRFTLGEIPELGFANRIMKVARGLRKFSAFRGLAFSISKMSELNRLYEEYPRSPRDFSRWKRRVDSILTEVRSKFR